MSIQDIYQYIYLIPTAIILLLFVGRSRTPNSQQTPVSRFSPLCIAIVLLLTFFIGLRPEFVGSDTTQYMQMYAYFKNVLFQFNVNVENLIFDNLFNYFGSLGFDISVLFILIAFIYFGCILIAVRKMFPQNQELAFLSYLVAFSTFSYGTDGIKAGAAAAIFLCALAYRDNKFLTIALALASVGFHHSMLVVVYAYILSSFYKQTKYYFYGWIVAVLLAIGHIGVFQTIFASYADDKAQVYLNSGGAGYMTGFRPDFILYSAGPVFVGYLMYYIRGIRNAVYELWLRMYLTMNSVWMLCMYASYTNRIAYLSWFMYPIVLLYPYFGMYRDDNQLVEGKKVAEYHMWFTIFMVVVYYGILR